MRQFRSNYDLVNKPVDIVIEPDGQVWVTITKPAFGTWNAYEKIEDLRAKDYGRPGSTRGRARRGHSARGGRDPYRFTRSGCHFDESHEYEPKRDPVADELIEQIKLQASLYMRTYGRDSTFRPDVL